MVDRHVEMLFAAGLSPSAIDVEPLAVSRSLIELGPDPYGQRTVAIINIGASNTDIGIFRNGILAFPRTLPLAGDSLTRAIAAQMGVTEEQAEELKLKYGEVIMDQPIQQAVPPADAFLDFGAQPTQEEAQQPAAPMPFDFSSATTEPAQPAEAPTFDLGEEPAEQSQLPAPTAQHDTTTLQVFSAMAPVLGELLTELRRSLEYYRGRTADGQIDEILLCGGSSRLKGLAEFLSSELQIPARVADPLQYVTVNARNFS